MDLKAPPNTEIKDVEELELSSITLASSIRNRKDEEEINELALSIEENGLLQPITVYKAADTYQLLCGEKRLLAVAKLGKKTIKAVVLGDK